MIQQNSADGLNVKSKWADVNKNASEVHISILRLYSIIIYRVIALETNSQASKLRLYRNCRY